MLFSLHMFSLKDIQIGLFLTFLSNINFIQYFFVVITLHREKNYNMYNVFGGRSLIDLKHVFKLMEDT
jgi:hypothetical protein